MRFIIMIFALTGSASSLAFDHSHSQWDGVLKRYVMTSGSDTKVKYHALKKDPQGLLEYLKSVSAVTKSEYATWKPEQKQAFLFNAYNAFTMKDVLDHNSEEKPLTSIKDIGGVFKTTWNIRFFSILGEESDLDHIKHDLARGNFDDPRMVFAFSEACLSGPALSPKAFVPEKISEQLDHAADAFLSDPQRNTYDVATGTLTLSKVFDWYAKDFDRSKKFGPLNKFLAAHLKLSDNDKKLLEQGKLKVKYMPFDWTLNSAKGL